MDVKVSVVVPVRNPGEGADACIRSVLDQSMAPEEYEVIFADDGSDDGIQQRLDAIAAVRSNVKVLHLTPTGSPMRGRNVGLMVARGEYVYLMNQTDRLERTALAAMYRRAVETEADILVGRLAGDRRPPAPAFEADRERADVVKDRLLGLLTPHKLYRRAFLDAEALNFTDPGGLLAEQAFVVRAYLRAKIISILAGQICCHVEEVPEPPCDPYDWVAELRELLDIIDDEVPEGRQRDRMYAHWFRTAVLRRLGGTGFATSSADRAATFTTLRELVVRRFPPRLDVHLPVHLRARAALLRAGRLDQLIVLAAAMRGVHLQADLREVVWEDGAFTMGLTVEIMRADGSPIRFVPYGQDGLLWEPPVPLDGLRLPPELADISQVAARARFEVYVRHEESGLIHFLPVRCSVVRCRHRNGVRLQVTGTARLDADSAALGGPLPAGLWEIHVRMLSGPHQARTRVTGMPLNCTGTLAGHSRRLIVPWWSDRGELGVCVEPRSFPESIVLVSPGTTVTRQRKHVFVVVPVPYVPPSGGPPAELVLCQTSGGEREVSAPALVEPGVPGELAGRLIAKIPTRLLHRDGYLSPGSWAPYLRVDGVDVGLRFRIEMSRGGRVEVRGAAAARPPEPWYPLLKRIALRVPGARGAVRATRAVRRRYLTG
ncbi:glycosyltransferase involved in cell wall biosynthesis [Streptosporangium becharense]|uniref:Glycosyltransferase involved in cell wall biosynthesis n=1 Tax=Streptosporangium becharense TaxID=1816182 RepID=A0A7W9IID0_9ACTN|nr:glycosyltransferase family A protein [Streptosporangium becharense]MBB2913426.1 glycosyltransferase involved in cell wall biosynthesis [Streptosporangium becharense]MBB5821116.1 glycosyltransferase involved in cell wall biosynthesis [Streptosporangium becharense]